MAGVEGILENWLGRFPIQDGEDRCAWAIRVFRQEWPLHGDNHLFEVLCACLEIDADALNTTAHRTLWLPDAPEVPDVPAEKLVQQFLEAVQRLPRRPRAEA